MPRQHQSSLLPAERQGEEGYETATKYPYLVRSHRVFHVVNVYLVDP
ncbi:DUF5431 family protein [Enterobacter asburiae]